MVLIWVNSDGVKGSSGCCFRHEDSEKRMMKVEKSNKRLGANIKDDIASMCAGNEGIVCALK